MKPWYFFHSMVQGTIMCFENFIPSPIHHCSPRMFFYCLPNFDGQFEYKWFKVTWISIYLQPTVNIVVLTNELLAKRNKLLSYIVFSLDPTDASNLSVRPKSSSHDPMVIFLAGFSIMWMKKAGSGWSFSSLKSPKTLWLAVEPNTPWKRNFYSLSWNFLILRPSEGKWIQPACTVEREEGSCHPPRPSFCSPELSAWPFRLRRLFLSLLCRWSCCSRCSCWGIFHAEGCSRNFCDQWSGSRQVSTCQRNSWWQSFGSWKKNT